MPDTLGSRIRQMMLDLSASKGHRVTLAEFGQLVGRVEAGRRRAYSATGISEWISGRSEPSLSAIKAMGKVTGRSPCWIAFGEEPDATSTPRSRA